MIGAFDDVREFGAMVDMVVVSLEDWQAVKLLYYEPGS